MKRRLLVGVVASSLVVLVGLIFLPNVFHSHGELRYIERTTGITFPSSLSQVEVVDNSEYYVVAHLRLRKEDIVSFNDNHEFDTTPAGVTPWIDVLRSENRIIPKGADVRYFEGHSEHNRWICALDQDSGRLWIVVFYPDPGGSLP